MSELRTLVIFGAAGDLTRRLLLPGLATCLAAGVPERGIMLVGSGLDEREDFAAVVQEAFAAELSEDQLALPAVRHTIDSARWITADATDPEHLAALLDQVEGPLGLYFALPPSVTMLSCEALSRLHDSGRLPQDTVLVLEKPFGTDLDSARDLNSLLAGFVPEERIFRVDHFLGLPGVLGFVGLRFANRILEPLWNREDIERIEIVFDEVLGLEGRAGFYEATGAARDMIQSHLLQVMALVMMDPPTRFDGVEIPANTAHVLRATRLWSGDATGESGGGTPAVVRGRYTAGTVDGRAMPSYVDEDGVDPARETETFAQVVVEVDSWRWNGVPVVLRSGKAIGSPRQEIAVVFRRPPHDYEQFPSSGPQPPDVLRVGFEDERIDLELNAGGPFDSRGMTRTVLSTELPEPGLTAYGSVLRWVLEGKTAFTVRGDGAEEGWRILAQIAAAYASGQVPLQDYEAGSAGPASAGLDG
ncbi:glucose-6-phosphate 1-dehydrogenase [Citricoccus zhacaiensis]|uniref:Glucose-6-phosphate 1-dehydrogenase n=1 Tax=Citricoccus zhacaiensis TaxID=489142 RepID=A0ABQ2MA43_9MICC|nr:glucose-6-phosphate dehydrogenase [Citricoccus zhacaiensis]GGO47763.1 glucose-6-phosphate 1-dehydrogenase [Citricoccus zhacaiensis]